MLSDLWLETLLVYDQGCGGPDGWVNWLDWASLVAGADTDLQSVIAFAGEWLQAGAAIHDFAPMGGDNRFDLKEFSVVAQNWLQVLPTDVTLLGYWSFNEETGSTAADSSGWGRNGTLVNMDSNDWVGGYLGNSLAFDGIDDFVRISGFKGISGSQTRTCTAWIKTDNSSMGEILGWGSTDPGGEWVIRIDENGALRVDASGDYVYGTTLINDNPWHHIAVVSSAVWHPFNIIDLYVDGQLEVNGGSSPIRLNTATSEDVKIAVFNSTYF